ncbi:catechol-2,3-dioxygenase [Paenibacillus sp. DS2015]
MHIETISLCTNRLEEMKTFYTDIMMCDCEDSDDHAFTVRVGQTLLIFEQHEQLHENPFYHFTMNIPHNTLEEARAWMANCIPLAEEDSKIVYDCPEWNSHSIYFYDPSGNIVELIARHSLDNAIERPFNMRIDLLCVSEIGIVVPEVVPFVRGMNDLGIPNWKEDHEDFTPLGNEEGLIIVVKQGRRWFYSNKQALFFPVRITIRGIGCLTFMNNGDRIIAHRS